MPSTAAETGDVPVDALQRARSNALRVQQELAAESLIERLSTPATPAVDIAPLAKDSLETAENGYLMGQIASTEPEVPAVDKAT